ncbi:MAG: hypothetical protein P8080_03530 [Gammaproteobacteria bacterium]
MRSDQRELLDGLGLCVLATVVGGLLIYGAVVVAMDEKFFRAGIYGLLGLVGLAWGIGMGRAEWMRYRASAGRSNG